MKANQFKRSATAIKGSEVAKSPRSHHGAKAPKGTSGETGEVGKFKSFIVRNHMLSNRDK